MPYDIRAIAENAGLEIPPLPVLDDSRRWCAMPWCLNQAGVRSLLCIGHTRTARSGGWTPLDLIARELVRASRAGAGCANPACVTLDREYARVVPDDGRQRTFRVRRAWGHFTPGGEFLCKVCANLVNVVADAFEPGTSPVDKAVERTDSVVRSTIPDTTYQRLTGQAMLRSKRRDAASLTLADGFTLEQFVLGLKQYVWWWATISDELYLLRSLDEQGVTDWISVLAETAEDQITAAIAENLIPDYSIPYAPSPLVLDALTGRLHESL